MHLDLPHLVYSGPPLEPGLIGELPVLLSNVLATRNGCIAWQGALHVRGWCLEPAWHSIQLAWHGPDSFHDLYSEVEASDIPFAEDAFGDQYLVRGKSVIRMDGETGDLSVVADALDAFFAHLIADASGALGFEPTDLVREIGGPLQPGQLVSVYPPFVFRESADGVSLRPIPALDRRRALASLAKQLRDLPDGSMVDIKIL
jgi:hypothetical protein